jgi:hypothetical protein
MTMTTTAPAPPLPDLDTRIREALWWAGAPVLAQTLCESLGEPWDRFNARLRRMVELGSVEELIRSTDFRPLYKLPGPKEPPRLAAVLPAGVCSRCGEVYSADAGPILTIAHGGPEAHVRPLCRRCGDSIEAWWKAGRPELPTL